MLPPAVPPDLARFLALVRRELGAHHVSVLEPGEETSIDLSPAESAAELRCALPDGRIIVARYEEAPSEPDVLRRRLEMLASTFDTQLAAEPEEPREEGRAEPRGRPPAGSLLREELEKLCERSGAINALVIDANSPILWGAARPRDVAPEAWTAFDSHAPDEGAAIADAKSVAATSRKALEAVRSLVDLAAMKKARRGRHVEREGDAPFVAHSFAGIYLLTLVFAAPFDELRAERAVVESIARIERLVLALPPLDPPPQKGAGVIAIRRPRRR